MDEKKVMADIKNISNKDLIFYVLNPVVNNQPYFKDDLANAVYTTQKNEDTEWSSEPFRDRDLKNPYFVNDKFPQGYVAGNENFYPMKLKAGEEKKNLATVKEYLDGMVSRGLISYSLTRLALVEVNTVAAPTDTTSSFDVVVTGTVISGGDDEPGFVHTGSATNDYDANVTILDTNGDPIIGTNSREVWGRVTNAVLGDGNNGAAIGEILLTISVYDDADKTAAAPAAYAWDAGDPDTVNTKVPKRNTIIPYGNVKVKAVNSDIVVHGVLIAKDKTKSVELTDAVQKLIDSGELAIV